MVLHIVTQGEMAQREYVEYWRRKARQPGISIRADRRANTLDGAYRTYVEGCQQKGEPPMSDTQWLVHRDDVSPDLHPIDEHAVQLGQLFLEHQPISEHLRIGAPPPPPAPRPIPAPKAPPQVSNKEWLDANYQLPMPPPRTESEREAKRKMYAPPRPIPLLPRDPWWWWD